jgi:hypothetical protein
MTFGRRGGSSLHKPNPAARHCESAQIPVTRGKRTMGLEPTTFGLGSHRTSASQSQACCGCSQDVAKTARQVRAMACEGDETAWNWCLNRMFSTADFSSRVRSLLIGPGTRILVPTSSWSPLQWCEEESSQPCGADPYDPYILRYAGGGCRSRICLPVARHSSASELV